MNIFFIIYFIFHLYRQEQTGLHPCDQRKDIGIRSKEYPSVDFSHVVSDADPLYDKYTISRGIFCMYNCIYFSWYKCASIWLYALIFTTDTIILHLEPDTHVAERGKEFLEWLSKRDEKTIVVVTHSAFLRHFFNLVVDSDDSDQSKYMNCEIRSYNLVLPDERNSAK